MYLHLQRILPSDHMKLSFPLKEKDAEQLYELIQNKRLHSSIEQFPMSLELISYEKFDDYIKMLLDQHKDSDRAMRNYIERIPLTEESQHFYRSLSVVGWHNSFSLMLIAHKRMNGQHKILIATLSKEVTVSLLYKLFSPIRSLLGMKYSEQKQMEVILTHLDQDNNKQTLENIMITIMAHNIRHRFEDQVDVNFLKG